jgi:hypothetical protein
MEARGETGVAGRLLPGVCSFPAMEARGSVPVARPHLHLDDGFALLNWA